MAPNTVGYWMPERMIVKPAWKELLKVIQSRGFSVVEVDLTRPLDQQQRFDIFLHKVSDFLAADLAGDQAARSLLQRFEEDLASHPNLLVIDPLDNVRTLTNRYVTYNLLAESELKEINVFIPNFALLSSTDLSANLEALKLAEVRFPLVCKPLVANGPGCHDMAIIFNEKGLAQCAPPCVAQTLINHNAVLFKLFIVGGEHYFEQRPSLKNFSTDEERSNIEFHSHTVSKPSARSELSCPDEGTAYQAPTVHAELIGRIAAITRKTLGMNLFGIDIIVDNALGALAIIDANYCPDYEGYPDFSASALRFIDQAVKDKFGK